MRGRLRLATLRPRTEPAAAKQKPYPDVAAQANFPQIEAVQAPGTHRILNVHRNVPGVLRDVNRIVSDRNANIQAQMLATDAEIGYLIMDLDRAVSLEVRDDIAALSTNIKTRILY